MENRTAFLLVGAVFFVVGTLFAPLLCGIGFLFVIIGAVMWARE